MVSTLGKGSSEGVSRWRLPFLVSAICLTGLLAAEGTVAAGEPKAERTFVAVVTDAQGVETEIKNVVFYWEEKISETSFVPHELRHVPAKRGTATVNIKFETIKQIEVKAPADKALPVMTVTLANGKTGEFSPAVPGSFKGESDFGPVEVPVTGVSKVMLR